MAGAAAIFDLDRTLVRTSTTPVLTQALLDQGVGRRMPLPGQGLLMRLYDVFGESLPSMAVARAAARMALGWPVAEVRAAAEMATDELERQVQPYVPALLASHRAAGRALVLATTTPFDLVQPLAARLGISTVIATRYGTFLDPEGIERYDGTIVDGFVWAAGKLQAVRRWAGAEQVDLRQSWAYSDSVYDLPLLSSVGHAVAVNPDYRLQAVAVARRWPVAHFNSPPGVPKLLGAEPMDVLRLLFQPALLPFARFDVSGTEHVPHRGPAIVVANHRSYFDPIVYLLAVFQAGRNPRGLAKKELFDAPVIGTLFRLSGAICVDRHASGQEAYRQAEDALANGEVVVVTPQGTIPTGEAFFDPRPRGKSGAARLASATGAPVIPLSVWGSEKVWPRSWRVPNFINVLNPPTIRVRVGPPIAGLSGTDFEADTEKIMAAITAQLPPEALLRRIPNSEELARTMPPGQEVAP
jgi:putative phosphoserine phosphatase/1-acylglycerol-3-phosphate O-acyltransferase